MAAEMPNSMPRRALLHGFTSSARLWLAAFISIAALASTLLLVHSHSQSRDVIRISLEDKSSIPPVQQLYGYSAADQPGDSPLRVAVAGVLSPSQTLEHYQQLLAYMAERLGRQVALIMKPTYAEIIDLVRGNQADVTFICSLAYVNGNQDFGMELLVAPQIRGETVYYSYLIVPAGSAHASLTDIRGGSFAFTDPLSNTGYLAPTYQLSLLGEQPVSFFGRYLFTYSHSNSIIAVADRLVDAAAVDSLVYDRVAADDPEMAARTKVIATWGPYGIPPLVVSPNMEALQKEALRDFFLTMDASEEGTRVLGHLGIDKFVVVPDTIYDPIREMLAGLEQ